MPTTKQLTETSKNRMAEEAARYKFQADVVANVNQELKTENERLTFALSLLRSSVAVYIHCADYDKDFLIQALEATSRKECGN